LFSTDPICCRPTWAQCSRRLWIEGLDLSQPEVLAQRLRQPGSTPSRCWPGRRAEVKAGLKACTEEAVRRGVFGAPTCFVGDEMFFGQDRLDFVAEALAAA
jgi:2-hydroxychromene-2-carboxylate isomerase